MNFRRTNSGLENQLFFFDADLVVYVEGVRDERLRLSLPEGEAQSLDALFWSELIKSFSSTKRIHFKELGSRSNLLEFSKSLNGRIDGKIVVCVDRDFDDLIGLDDSAYRCLVKTWSYSWESDVWSFSGVIDVLNAFIPVGGLPHVEVERLQDVWLNFFSRISRFIALDAKAVAGGFEAVIRRTNPNAIMIIDRDHAPTLNLPYFSSRLRDLRCSCSKPFKRDLMTRVNSERHLFGKSAMSFGYHLFVSSLRFVGVPSQISLEPATSLAIRLFGGRLRDGRDSRFDYYRMQFSSVGVELSART